MSGRWRTLLRSERGSFTVEATLVFPMIITLTVVCLLLSLTTCQSALVAVTASLTADRAAYVWDNSAKNAVTGAFPPEQRDPLYARSFVNDLTALLGAGDSADASWSIAGLAGSGASLSERKLSAAAQGVPSGFTGSVEYRNRWFLPRIQVQLASSLRFALPIGGKAAPFGATSNAYVVSPEELIRNVNLVASYASRIRDYIRRAAAADSPAPILPGPGSTSSPEPTPISSEAEAKAYIRKLVHGGGARFDTVIDHYRQVDAVDPDGVAHEAKYTVNQADAKRQIAKDQELMKSGAVKGVVWHFFPYRKTGRVQLSDSLRALLERSGIIVIIHQG